MHCLKLERKKARIGRVRALKNFNLIIGYIIIISLAKNDYSTLFIKILKLTGIYKKLELTRFEHIIVKNY